MQDSELKNVKPDARTLQNLKELSATFVATASNGEIDYFPVAIQLNPPARLKQQFADLEKKMVASQQQNQAPSKSSSRSTDVNFLADSSKAGSRTLLAMVVVGLLVLVNVVNHIITLMRAEE